MLELANQEEQTRYDLAKARLSKCLYWVETKFDWRPKSFYQELLLGCYDNVYNYPTDYFNAKLAGQPINKYAWRIGRQSGKTECLALGALYLAICKPVKKFRWRGFINKDLISETNPRGWTSEKIYYYNGADIILASADAGKAKIVYDRVMEYLTMNAEYSQMIAEGIIKIRQQPFFQITFFGADWKEPATIQFRGPGSKGQALRGQSYDYKLYDEADYFPNSFYEAEKATTINAPDATLTILSSTPSGRHEHFYKACFPAGTPVITKNGPKPIENIHVGEEVYNRWGELEKVSVLKDRKYNGRFVKIQTTFNDEVVTTTFNHKFMAIRKKERYCKGCQKFIWEESAPCLMSGKHNLGTPEAHYVEANKLRTGDFLAIPCGDWIPPSLKICHIENKTCYVPITSIEFVENTETQTVYNLTVGEDHSYLVNYYGVENCTDARWGYKEFHFSSWENPNYNEEKDREFRAELNHTGYMHEIMADWGSVENGVFDWTYFEKVFDYQYKNNAQEREYRCIRIGPQDITAVGPTKLGAWLSKRLPLKNPHAKYWFGADLGFSADPSEFVVFEEFNGVMKLIVRVHQEHVTYDIQCELICALDNYYKFQMLGMDAGNVGSALAHMLQSRRYARFVPHKFDKRLKPIPFGGRLPIGKVNGKEITEPSKTAMTNMIVGHAEAGLLRLPGLKYDDDIENQFRNHTYSHGQNGLLIYAKSSIFGDHVIDAIRTAFYVKAFMSFTNIGRSWSTGTTFRAGNW